MAAAAASHHILLKAQLELQPGSSHTHTHTHPPIPCLSTCCCACPFLFNMSAAGRRCESLACSQLGSNKDARPSEATNMYRREGGGRRRVQVVWGKHLQTLRKYFLAACLCCLKILRLFAGRTVYFHFICPPLPLPQSAYLFGTLLNLSHKLFAYFRVIGNTMYCVCACVYVCVRSAFKGVKVQIYFEKTFCCQQRPS